MKRLIKLRRNLLILTLANVLIFIGCSKKDDADTTAPKLPDTAALTIKDVKAQEATLSWTAATDDRTAPDKLLYLVQWQASSTTEVSNSGSPQPNLTEYTLTGLTEKTAYKVWVTVTDEAGNHADYEAKDFTTPEAKDTEAPKAGTLEVTPTDPTTATAKWTAATDNRTPADKLKYQVQWNAKGSTEVKNSGEAKAALTEFNLTGLTENTTYEVKVTVTDEAGNTASYATKEVTTPLTKDTEAPKAGNLSVTPTDPTTANAKWTAATDNRTPADKLKYQVQWNVKGSTEVKNSGEAKAALTEFNLTGLTENTTYEVKVTVTDEAGNTASYATKEVTTPLSKDTEAPAKVVINVKNIRYDRATITWTQSTDNRTPQEKMRYSVCWKNLNTNAVKVSDTFTDVVVHHITDLTINTPYYVWVVAMDEAGNKSESEGKNFTTAADKISPSAVTVSVSKVGENKATITWDTADDDVTPVNKMRYRVVWRNIFTKKQSKLLTNVTSFQITNLTPSNAYMVRVISYDEAGNHNSSTEIPVITLKHDSTPPVVNEKPVVENLGSNSATVRWYALDEGTKADDMRYKLTLKKGYTIINTFNIGPNVPMQYTFTNLDSNSDYTVWIEAIDEGDNYSEMRIVSFTTRP